ERTGGAGVRPHGATVSRLGPVNRIQDVLELEPVEETDVRRESVQPAVAQSPRPEPAREERQVANQDASRLASTRDRIAALRERLAAAARPPAPDEPEPEATAAAVREVVEELRSRLDAVIRERAELAKSLEEARDALARAEAEIARERKARVAAELKAEERARIADEAVAEAEAVAAERDQILAELSEQRRLDDEQAALLLEAESALDQRDAEKAALARELEKVLALVDAREAEIADLEGKLEVAAAERARLEARIRELEAEVARLTEASKALRAIEETVKRRK
ncbi:MAG TPA: hypothetical protein VNZ57_15880, partial [Longimicrobiales bacterium]|nr:hypothetical protein [Longimicrobiales bacterium]